MPILRIEVSQFSNQFVGLNGTHHLNVSKVRCIKAAKSIGVPLLRAGTPTSAHAVTMATYKGLAVKAAIDFTGASLLRPQAYNNLDPSEKANISYWTGMTFATLAANMILSVPRLIHAAALTKAQPRLALTIPANRSLADLVGQDMQGNWHVLEGKARQDDPSSARRNIWKQQSGNVASIGGVVPVTRSYCLANVADVYTAELVDPLPEQESIELQLVSGQASIVEAYYGAYRDFLESSEQRVILGGHTVLVRLATYDQADNQYIFVGMDEVALGSVRNRRMPGLIREAEGDSYLLGEDAIAVLLSPSADVQGEWPRT